MTIMEEEDIMDQLQQYARDGTQSPLFEPQRLEPDVPVAVMVSSTADASSTVSSHITKLKAIEADARVALAS